MKRNSTNMCGYITSTIILPKYSVFVCCQLKKFTIYPQTFKKKSRFTDGCWHSSTEFHPAHVDGCGAQCFAGVQCASIFNPARVSSPNKPPSLFCGLALFARPLQWSRPADLKRGHGAPVVWFWHKQECIRLPYTAALASQRAFVMSHTGTPRERGKTRSARPWVSSDQSPGWR